MASFPSTKTQTSSLPKTLGLYVLEPGGTHRFTNGANLAAISVDAFGTLDPGLPPRRSPRVAFLRERDRVAEVRRCDQGAESDLRGDDSRRREGRDRAEPRLVVERAPGEVIVRPGVVEAECFGALPTQLRVGPPRSRKDADPEAHLRSSALRAHPLQ